MKSKFKNLSTFKKLTLLAVIIILVFIIINVIWLVRFAIPYYGYVHTEGFYLNDSLPIEIDNSEIFKQYNKESNGYFLTVKNCHYLGSDGFLKVSKPIERISYSDNDGAANIDTIDSKSYMLFIWPDTFKGYSYGVLVDDAGTGEYQTIPIDENLKVTFNYLDETEKEHDQIIIDNNYDEINSMIKLAKDEWGLQKWHDFKEGFSSLFSKLS